MDRLKISTRLNLLVGALLTLLFLIAGSGLVGLSKTDDALQQVFEQSVSPMASVAEIQERLLRNRLAVAAAIVTPDDATIARSTRDIEDNIEAIDAVWKRFVAGPMSDEQRQMAETFAVHRTAFVREGLLPVVAALRQHDLEAANRLVVGALRPRYATVADDIKALMSHLVESAKAQHAGAIERYERLRNLSIGLCIGAAILALGFGHKLTRSVSTALRQAIHVAESVANGDLSAQVKVTGDNEISQLLFALERMRGSLESVVARVRRDAEGVATASAQIAQGNTDLSSRTEEQAAALEQTAASMSQLDSAVKQNTNNARHADELARTASHVASKGGAMVSQVVHTMQDINDSARKIGEIIGVVDSIAFQTNILALNAAVEAARAGEQGRGFAVVAGEVRSLAQRTAQAAREIKTLVTGSLERVENGVQLVSDTGAAVEGLVSSIHQVSSVVAGISLASNEQSAGVVQIGVAVNQMDQATQQNSALVEQTAAAAESLRVQAHQLVKAVEAFRINAELAG